MNRQTLSLILVAVAFAVTAYLWINYSRTRPAIDTGKTEESEVTVERLLAEVKRLQEVRLDTSLFQDRLFQALQEPPVPPETAVTPGRTNPFEPF